MIKFLWSPGHVEIRKTRLPTCSLTRVVHVWSVWVQHQTKRGFCTLSEKESQRQQYVKTSRRLASCFCFANRDGLPLNFSIWYSHCQQFFLGVTYTQTTLDRRRFGHSEFAAHKAKHHGTITSHTHTNAPTLVHPHTHKHTYVFSRSTSVQSERP